MVLNKEGMYLVFLIFAGTWMVLTSSNHLPFVYTFVWMVSVDGYHNLAGGAAFEQKSNCGGKNFLDSIKSRVYTNPGTENGLVAAMQCYLRR